MYKSSGVNFLSQILFAKTIVKIASFLTEYSENRRVSFFGSQCSV